MANVVLIVDDMPINVELLSNILESANYEVMAAHGGLEALELLKGCKPDLILLDLMMPDIDGFEVIRRIKDIPGAGLIPVIFVTGADDEVMEEQGIELGAVDYIRKPFNPTVVQAKVRNHIDLKLYRDELETKVRERTKLLEESALKLKDQATQLAASREAIIMGMSLMSEMYDKVTGDHISRIKSYTKCIAEKLAEIYPELLPDGYDDIVLYSPLHDLGKVSIPDSILHKTGVLTPEEQQVMRNHTLDGGAILRKTGSFLSGGSDDSDLKVAIEIAECHHEKYDGTGYPRGLAGDDIPISAKIVALADIYDALRSDRPYKKPFSHEETLNIMLCGDKYTKPEHFDPRTIEAFRLVREDLDTLFTSSVR